jgi:hypothetical protein
MTTTKVTQAQAKSCLDGLVGSQAQMYIRAEDVLTLSKFIEQHPDEPEKPATRYDWSTAPEWAMWAATDEYGAQTFFEDRPLLTDNGGMKMWIPPLIRSNILVFRSSRLDTRIQDFFDSLEQRPSA